MSEMRKALGNVNKTRMQKIMEAKGFDVTSPDFYADEERKRLGRDHADQVNIQKKKKDAFKDHSFWAGGEATDFKFPMWHPELQADAVKARAVGTQAWVLTKELKKTGVGNVMMVGEPGAGKTSLAIAIARELEKVGKTCIFLATNQLKIYFQHEYWNDDRIRNKVDIALTYAKTADVLILDDFGTEASGGRDGIQGVNRTLYTTMKALADERYDGNANRAKGINIITTNNTFDELEQMYDPKIMSRFLPGDADHVITFEGLDDMRGKGH